MLIQCINYDRHVLSSRKILPCCFECRTVAFVTVFLDYFFIFHLESRIVTSSTLFTHIHLLYVFYTLLIHIFGCLRLVSGIRNVRATRYMQCMKNVYVRTVSCCLYKKYDFFLMISHGIVLEII